MTTSDTDQALVDGVRARLDAYRHEGLGQVQGWFDVESAEVIAELLLRQVDRGIRGNVAEIGVHHGKSFLLLANSTRPDETAVALDVFGDQDKNVDHSGEGDLEVFRTNVASWAPDARLVIHQCSSLDVTPETAVATFGSVRFFSVDGGHTADITHHDLVLAETCLTDDGLVVLDDLLNAHWMGVLTGAARYLTAGDRGLTPFAYSSNKLYLAAEPAARDYAAHLRDRLPDLLGKEDVEMFGTTIDVYGQGSARRRDAEHARVQAARAVEKQHARTRRRARQLRRRLDEAQQRIEELEARSWRSKAGRTLRRWRRGGR
jgi:hypothetical protein